MTNSCLGIFYNKNYVKYAKLVRTNSGTIEIKKNGIQFLKGNLSQTIKNIVAETDSSNNTTIVSNLTNVVYNEFQMFKQISNSDMGSAINLEFEDWCEKFGLVPADCNYVYTLSDLSVGDYKKGMMAISKLNQIEEQAMIGEQKIDSIYPIEMMIPTIASKKDKDYLLVDLSEKLMVNTIIDGKTLYMTNFECGMSQILEKFEDILGSYEKAYEACKKVNVFNDDSETSSEKIQLEQIIEPVLQEILGKVATELTKSKDDIKKIVITGVGVLFTNIDTLFSEYFNLKVDILKPDFMSDIKSVQNLSELIECMPAIALAKENIAPIYKNVDLLRKIQGKKLDLKKIFLKKKDKNAKEKNKTQKVKPMIISFPEMISKYAPYPIIVLVIPCVAYFTVSTLYMKKVNSIQTQYNNKISEYESQVSKINNDTNEIKEVTNKYEKFNNQVDSLKIQLESSSIGTKKTNNISSFMQKLIKVVPSNVTLKSITSNNDKSIVLIAQANGYPEIGYFIANLRLSNDVLKNVTISNIQNSSTVTVTIGGELP